MNTFWHAIFKNLISFMHFVIKMHCVTYNSQGSSALAINLVSKKQLLLWLGCRLKIGAKSAKCRRRHRCSRSNDFQYEKKKPYSFFLSLSLHSRSPFFCIEFLIIRYNNMCIVHMCLVCTVMHAQNHPLIHFQF